MKPSPQKESAGCITPQEAQENRFPDEEPPGLQRDTGKEAPALDFKEDP